MNTKQRRGTTGKLRRSAVVLGVVGLAASAGLLMAGSALAGVGSQPGDLELLNTAGGSVITTGLLTSTPSWQTTTACPSGFQGSAQLYEFWNNGTSETSISTALTTGLANSSGFGPSGTNGTLDSTIGSLLNGASVSPSSPGTVEWVVGCYSGTSPSGTSNVEWTQSLFISVAAGATSYTASASGPVVENTTTSLIATPNPVGVGATVTLTANVTGAAGSATPFPAGTVQFENCPTPSTCTNINAAVAVNTGNVSASATTTTSFGSAGSVNLAAVFTPSTPTSVAGSTGTFSLAVGSLLATGANPVAVSVTVPSTGTLSVSVATGSVTLTPAAPATTPDETATGTLNNVTVIDSRNTFPGWSVAGQESVFTGSGTSTIPASSLGWTPAFVGSAVGGAVIGSPVAPVGANTGSSGPGLGTAATLASATPGNGFGTNTMNAGLLLDIPSTTPPGAYAGNLTITYVTAGP
jgi:hypothetical protein